MPARANAAQVVASTTASARASGELPVMPPTSVVSNTKGTSIACGDISLPWSTDVCQLKEYMNTGAMPCCDLRSASSTERTQKFESVVISISNSDAFICGCM